MRTAALAAMVLTVAVQPLVAGPAGSQSLVVSPLPINESPRILDGTVYAIVEAGNKIIVGGTFTTVRDYNSTVQMTRRYIFAFDKVTGLIDPLFAPVVNGLVNSLVASPDGQWVYVGGAFTTVDGVTRSKLARLSVADGQADSLFKGRADQNINDMALAGDALVIAGRFRKIDGVSRERLGAVDAVTGALLTWFDVPVTGQRDASTSPYVYELDVSPDGSRLAIVGDFLNVGGLAREQLALIDLTTRPVSVANWATSLYHSQCASAFTASYMRDVAFSPDSSFLVVGTTGAFFANTLCDTATRWEVNQTGTLLTPTWVSVTGGDTVWHVTVTDAAVYAGGHQRWHNNPTPSPRGNDDGPGSVSRSGIAALDPLTGVPLSWNPGRDRGHAVEAFLATSDRLYVGSDTTHFDNRLRERLAVLPVAGGTPNPAPDALSLPVNLYAERIDNGTISGSTFDGATLSTALPVSGPGIDGIDWTGLRDGFVQKGQLFYFGPSGAYYKRTFDGVSFGPVTNLSTSVGYVDTDASLTPYDQPYNVDTTRAVAYLNGRLYYTRTNNTGLFWRWFSIESGIVGAQEYVASTANWSGATALEIAGNQLYASWNDNKLYRFAVNGPVVDSLKVLVDDGAVSLRPWAQVRALFFRS
jgi:hypothetical protein